MPTKTEKVRMPAPIPSTRACDNPECGKRLKWSSTRGRPSLYCSEICRKRAVSAAGKLSRAVHTQQRRLAEGSLSYRAQRVVRAEIARLEWLLSMYPASARPSTDSTISTTP